MARTKKRFNAIHEEQADTVKDSAAPGTWRTGLYARLSVDNEDGGKNSIESQLQILHSYFRDKPEFVIIHEYIDKGYSGTTFHRPAFEEMMEDIRNGKLNCLATKDLSRLGRDYLETSNYVETIFPFLGVRYISVNDHFDTNRENNGNKDLEIALKNLVNDMYARDISRRVSVVQKQDQSRGRFVGSNAPYGYRVDEGHPLRRFVVDESAAEIVRSIYDMALQGKRLREISLQLQEKRIRIPGSYLKTKEVYLHDGEPPQQWYVGTISNILSNQAYIGNLVQGKRKTRMFRGEKQHFTDREDWIITENAHEPVVSREVFEAVRNKMDKRLEKSSFRTDRTGDIPIKPDKYHGILFCGICGRKMRFASYVTADELMLRKYRYYCDNDYQLGKVGSCRTGISECELDRLVKQLLGDVLRSYENAFAGSGKTLQEISEGYLKAALVKKEREIRRLKAELQDRDMTAGAVYEAYVLGKISKNDYLQRNDKAASARVKLEKRIRTAEEDRDSFTSDTRNRIQWLQGLSAASEGDPDYELLHLLISRIDLSPKHRITITYPFSAEDILVEEILSEKNREEQQEGGGGA